MLASASARALAFRPLPRVFHRRAAATTTMASAAPEQIGQNKMFGGYSRRFKHQSDVLGCSMTFTIYLPPAAESSKVPIIYFLSGLTCTDENFTTKAGAQRKAAELGVALVAPDTSPRGLGVEGEADSWDFGVGAGEGGWARWHCLRRISLWQCSSCSAEDCTSCTGQRGCAQQAAPAHVCMATRPVRHQAAAPA